MMPEALALPLLSGVSVEPLKRVLPRMNTASVPSATTAVASVRIDQRMFGKRRTKKPASRRTM